MTRTDEPVIDQRVMRALSHPLRQRILRVLNERVASPNEIAGQLGERLGKVSYHIRILRDNGAIELVRTRQVRGAVQHFYRPLRRPFLDDDQWAHLPLSTRRSLYGQNLQQIFEHVGEAAATTGFDHVRCHVSWTTLNLDDEAYDALADRLADVLDYAQSLEAEVIERQRVRTEDTPAGSHRTELAILHFHRAVPPSRRNPRTKSSRESLPAA